MIAFTMSPPVFLSAATALPLVTPAWVTTSSMSLASKPDSSALSCKPSRCGAVPLLLLILLMVPKLLSASLEQQQREWPPSDLDAVLDVAHAVRALGLQGP